MGNRCAMLSIEGNVYHDPLQGMELCSGFSDHYGVFLFSPSSLLRQDASTRLLFRPPPHQRSHHQQQPPLPTTKAIPATVTIELQAFNGAFSPGTIEVPACSNVTIRFINYDVDIPHNFALYTGPGAQQVIYQGEVILGSQPFNYTFQAPCAPGTYFFRDDRHPTMLTGSFVVR